MAPFFILLHQFYMGKIKLLIDGTGMIKTSGYCFDGSFECQKSLTKLHNITGEN